MDTNNIELRERQQPETTNSQGSRSTKSDGSPNSKGSENGTSAEDDLMHWKSPRHGCLVLGDDECSYYTIYKVDHKAQRVGLMGEIFFEECLPCTLKKKRKSCPLFCVNLFGSEAFLVTLHMIVIALGAVKEAFDLRETNELLHLVHSLLETLATSLLVISRCIFMYSKYKRVEKAIVKQEHIEKQEEDNLRGDQLQWYIILYNLYGVFLNIIAWGCFVSFYYLAHLGWTILSNNFALITITIVSNIMNTRLERITDRIQSDQHKMALYESIMLLREVPSIIESGSNAQETYIEKTKQFANAVLKTDKFNKPRHIKEEGTAAFSKL